MTTSMAVIVCSSYGIAGSVENIINTTANHNRITVIVSSPCGITGSIWNIATANQKLFIF